MPKRWWIVCAHRHAQHARELVAQRAAAVGLDVRRRQRDAEALARQERAERGLFAVPYARAHDRLGPGVALALAGEQHLVERRGLEDLALQRRRRGQQPRVEVGQRLLDALARRALEQRRELQQLQVAHDPVGDVQIGVQAQLAQAPADARDAREHLLAHHLHRPAKLLQLGVVALALAVAFVLAHAVGRRLGLALLVLAAERHARQQVRAHAVERRGRRLAQVEETLDALARVGRHLRQLDRERERGDHVELAPPRDLDHAREIGLAQLDRRARERAHDRGGVVRFDQQARPGEHVAHLRALQERRRVVLAARRLARRGGHGSRGWHRPRIRAPAQVGAQARQARRRASAAPARAQRRPEPPSLAGYALKVDAVDWGTAQQIGELVAGSPPFGGVRRSSVQPLADDFAGASRGYSGLRARQRSRRRWRWSIARAGSRPTCATWARCWSR